MKTRVMTKKATQATILALRQAGYEVVQKHSGLYEAHVEGTLVFAAAKGARGYLVRYNETLLTEGEK